MRPCTKCNEMKHLSEFYKQKGAKDGYRRICKTCARHSGVVRYANNAERGRERTRQYRIDNPEKERECHLAYVRANPEKVKESELKYRKNNPEKVNEYQRKYRKNNPIKRKAQKAVSYAIQKGRLFRPENCSVCHNHSNIDAHHSDYAKPLDVIWMCGRCHKAWHRNNIAING